MLHTHNCETWLTEKRIAILEEGKIHGEKTEGIVIAKTEVTEYEAVI